MSKLRDSNTAAVYNIRMKMMIQATLSAFELRRASGTFFSAKLGPNIMRAS